MAAKKIVTRYKEVVFMCVCVCVIIIDTTQIIAATALHIFTAMTKPKNSTRHREKDMAIA